jgi:hypothetical protein
MAMMGWYLLTALALGLVSGCDTPARSAALAALSSAPTHPHHGSADHGHPTLYDKDARPFGFSMQSWAEEWWRWAYSLPMAINPNFHATADCDQHQQGPVFFLPASLGGTESAARSCYVPGHKAVAVLLPSVLNEYPCPDATFKPAPGQTLFELLSAGAKQREDDIAELDATLDGKRLDDLMSHRLASEDLFYLTGDTSLQVSDRCVSGTEQPAVVDSYMIVLRPLKPGTHTLTTRSVTKAGVITTASATLTVPSDD